MYPDHTLCFISLALILAPRCVPSSLGTVCCGAHGCACFSPGLGDTLWDGNPGQGLQRGAAGKVGWGSGEQAATHRYVEVDVGLIEGHRGGVEARGLHGDGPGKQEKDDEGGGHKADEHGQEHEELPVGKRKGPG